MDKAQLKGKISRWVMYLTQFSFKVEHRPGRVNELADALSRANEEVKEPTIQ